MKQLFLKIFSIFFILILLFPTASFARNGVTVMISLPEGDIAPEGGVSVEVFVATAKPISGGISGGGGGGGSGSVTSSNHPGLVGTEKPWYEASSSSKEFSGNKSLSRTVVIPEGEDSVEIFLKYPFSSSSPYQYIGFFVLSSGYYGSGGTFYTSNREYYQFAVQVYRNIYGSVSVSDAPKEDTSFSVIAQGSETFIVNGVIPAGERKVNYVLPVKDNASYTMLILFSEQKYLRTELQKTVTVAGYGVADVNFKVKKSNRTTVTLTLPENFQASEDISLELTLQSANEPYYYLDSETVTIPLGETSATVELYDDMASEHVICYYRLSDTYDGLYPHGHYSANGTTAYVSYAERFADSDGSILLPLLREKTLSVNLQLPEGEFAPVNIYGTVTCEPVYTLPQEVSLLSESNQSTVFIPSPVVSGGGGGGGSISIPVVIRTPLIYAGQMTGTVHLTFPEEAGCQYRIAMKNFDGDYRYYSGTYYYQENGSTVLRNNATLIGNETQSVTVTLMKQNQIFGTVTSAISDRQYDLIAAYQEDTSVREDQYTSDFSVPVDVSAGDSYTLALPAELEHYILMLQSHEPSYTLYYTKNGLTERLEDAELLSVTESLTGIDLFDESTLTVLPITINNPVQINDTEEWKLILKNSSVSEKEELSLRAAFYDGNGKILGTSETEIESVPGSSKGTYLIQVPKLLFDVSAEVKLFLWNENGVPMSLPYILKEKAGYAWQYADVWLTVGDTNLYRNGVAYDVSQEPIALNDCIYTGARTFAEAFYWDISYDADTAETIMTDGTHTFLAQTDSLNASFDGEEILLPYAPTVINGRTLFPFAFVAELFGYHCEENIQNGTVGVFDAFSSLIRYAEKNCLIPESFFDTALSSEITRQKAASILVKFYEKISGAKLALPETNPYTDTQDENALKLYQSGVMKGYEDGCFRPDTTLTHSELCTLICRLLMLLEVVLPSDYEATEDYTDFPKDIGNWAEQYVYGLKAYGALENVFDTVFEPYCTASKEKMVAILANCYRLIQK